MLFIKTDNPLAIARVEFHDSDPSHNRCLNIPLADAADRIIGKHMDQFDSVAVALQQRRSFAPTRAQWVPSS